MEQLPLVRQLDMAFKRLYGEMDFLSSGTVFVQIRNNSIGKFGIRHNPVESRDGVLHETKGLTEAQKKSFAEMAVHSLKMKKHWTHGEIYYDFTVRQNVLVTSVQFESNYNMANLLTEISQNRY
ncbi:O-methyltransferase [Paenibacillus gansuensis]|uniref:O-methyltransferase n=1 Tax=Paenibacillus gansuensis TaxID=306542 RepID=A0ABW5PH07_9BACL